jgi:hypothetical protein
MTDTDEKKEQEDRCVRYLLVKNLTELMVTTRDRRVHADVCEMLHKLGALTDQQFERLVNGWSK